MTRTQILRTLYGSLWKAAIPLLRHHKRLKDGFQQRLVPASWPFAGSSGSFPEGPRIWFQAASGGEATLLFPIIQQLYELFVQDSATLPVCICTSCTQQGLEIIEKNRPLFSHEVQDRLFSGFFPLDAPEIMIKAIQQAAPDLVVLLETELWPGLIHELKTAQIPYIIANARMTEKTFSSYRLAKKFFTSHQPAEILATTGENAVRFSSLFDMQASQVANIKYDIVRQQLGHKNTDNFHAGMQQLRTLLRLPGDCPLPPVLTLASVREEEEQLLLPLVQQISRHFIHSTPCLCCIAPRHMHRVDAWATCLEQSGLSFVRKSALGEVLPGSPKCILWDTFGEMDMLYALSDVAFVGGSLAPLGGQNFLEPLALGTVAVIGPSWENFAWVGHDLFETGFLQKKQNTSEVLAAMLSIVDTLLSGPNEQWEIQRKTQKQAVRQATATAISRHTGGSLATAQIIKSYLDERVHKTR